MANGPFFALPCIQYRSLPALRPLYQSNAPMYTVSETIKINNETTDPNFNLKTDLSNK